MIIVNPGPEDYHMHSSTFSDGFSSIDEMVRYAGEIGLKKIAITDHSQITLDLESIAKKTFRDIINYWENVHNDVQVSFGVEGDLLNEEGNICDHIQDIPTDFLILSAHTQKYAGRPDRITSAYIQALKKHHSRIKFIGHPNAHYFSEYVDMDELIRAANDYGVPLEFNCSVFIRNQMDLRQLEIMLTKANQIYVNSDAHTLSQMKLFRPRGLLYLKQQGLLG